VIDALRARRRPRIGVVLLLLAIAAGISSLPGADRAAAAVPVFSDGFETGSMHAWTASKGMAAQQQTVHAGTWAATTTAASGPMMASVTLPGTYPEMYLKTWVYLKTFTSRVTLLRMDSAAGVGIESVGVLPSGRLFTMSGSKGKPVPAQHALPLGGWHELQLHAAIHGATGQVDVWLDGAPVTELSKKVQLGSALIGRVEIGQSSGSPRFSASFDDVDADPAYIDDLGPSVPAGLHVTPLSSDSIEVSWDATPDVGTAGYTVYRLEGLTWEDIGSPTLNRYVDVDLDATTTYTYAVDSVDTSGTHSSRSLPVSGTTRPAGAVPVSHVVIIDMENHSFDNVLGKLCAEVAAGVITDRQPCDGATTGVLSDGSVVPLTQATDIVAGVGHEVEGQQAAIDGGRMDGFDQISGCGRVAISPYACYSQFDPSQIPNLAALAERYAISDRTFEFSSSPSWAGHMVLASGTQDGFQGDIPTPSTFTTKTGPGWGCDSYRDAQWWDGSAFVLVPSCIPDRSGAGPYRPSPVSYVPTIFDRLDASGLSWKIYGGSGPTKGYSSGYGWAICPTFFECLGSAQKANWVPAQNVISDGGGEGLPNFSIVAPPSAVSQHNGYSMTAGDNWLGQVVRAIQSGPDWASTAIFITYDDCGCFYDHVPPPWASAGIRVPMVIVSPYAKLGATDSTPATYVSLLAYTENIFGLAPLASADAAAYDYGSSFDYTAPPAVGPPAMVHRVISAEEQAWIRAHPPKGNDPT
jgi:phospholipase C